jgi:hypothetical protein
MSISLAKRRPSNSRDQRNPVVRNRQAANATEFAGIAEFRDAREDDSDDQWNDDHADSIHENRTDRCGTFRQRKQPCIAGSGGAEADGEAEHETGGNCQV